MSTVLTTTGQRITAEIPLTIISLSPLHHGAGVSGNTQRLRTQPAVNPYTGEEFTCPIVSGNSLRHAIRHACAEITLGAVDATPGSLSKPLVDLLYTGGALSGSDGSNVDLDGHRRLDGMWAPAGLLGYSGRGQIWAGSLYCDILLPVCRENTWRMPERLKSLPAASMPVAALREEDFGTRHDPVGTSADRWLNHDLWLGLNGDRQSNQMIFDWQVVKAGTVWYGNLTLAAATVQHAQALRVAWEWLNAAGTMHLGAKRAQGYGRCKAEADWSALPDLDTGWVAELSGYRDELMALLAQAAGK